MKMNIVRLKNLPRYRTQLFVVLIALGGTLYSFISLTSWKYAVVGDEWACFFYAKGIAEAHLLVNPFGLHGVYGEQQVFESYYQALFLFLFQGKYLAWKAANMVLLFPSVIFLYKLVRNLYGEVPALIAALLLAFSKYLCNIFKVGNPHCFGFLLFILGGYLASALLAAPTKSNALKLGICLGLSFFTYVGPIFSFFLLPFSVPLFRRYGKQALKPIAIVVLVLLLFVVLGLGTTPANQWSGMLKKTTLKREFDSNVQVLLNIGHNFLLFWKNFDYFYNHFVAGPYLDMISRWAALAGIIWCVFSFRRKEGLLLFLWIFLCMGIGLTNPYRYTPSTRGIFFIPYGVMFASVGFEFLRKRLRRWGGNWLTALAVLAALGLNIYEAQVGVFAKTGYSVTALILKELLQPAQNAPAIVVFHSNQVTFDRQHVDLLMALHGIPSARFALTQDLREACRAQDKVVIVFKADPLFQQGDFQTLCPESPQGTKVIAIQGYGP